MLIFKLDYQNKLVYKSKHMTLSYMLYGNSISEVIKKRTEEKNSFLKSFTQIVSWSDTVLSVSHLFNEIINTFIIYLRYLILS